MLFGLVSEGPLWRLQRKKRHNHFGHCALIRSLVGTIKDTLQSRIHRVSSAHDLVPWWPSWPLHTWRTAHRSAPQWYRRTSCPHKALYSHSASPDTPLEKPYTNTCHFPRYLALLNNLHRFCGLCKQTWHSWWSNDGQRQRSKYIHSTVRERQIYLFQSKFKVYVWHTSCCNYAVARIWSYTQQFSKCKKDDY